MAGNIPGVTHCAAVSRPTRLESDGFKPCRNCRKGQADRTLCTAGAGTTVFAVDRTTSAGDTTFIQSSRLGIRVPKAPDKARIATWASSVRSIASSNPATSSRALFEAAIRSAWLRLFSCASGSGLPQGYIRRPLADRRDLLRLPAWICHPDRREP